MGTGTFLSLELQGTQSKCKMYHLGMHSTKGHADVGQTSPQRQPRVPLVLTCQSEEHGWGEETKAEKESENITQLLD